MAVATPVQDAEGGDDAVALNAAPSEYVDFRVLLDSPAEHPGLGFDNYAEALAEVVVSSRAEFAVGIFGRWGSGKTTLMKAIKRKLDRDESVVSVWFPAWRYEKDPNLILPLLDVLREALEDRDRGERGWAHEAAVAISRAGLAFLGGLRLSASLPVGVGADLEVGKTIEAIRASRERPAPLSLYHAGYRMLGGAIENLSAGGTRRVVIFIDDLDRCLPTNALDALESMKLFFDVEGCVFVVGLDREIIERAVALKYRSIADEGATQPSVSGSDYVKKIFQVPFTLPPVAAVQLQGYLDIIERSSGFAEAQRRDFTENVRPHFGRLQGGDSVNPREIKRLINLYTMQVKMLSWRLGASLNPNVMLALLCMNFRDGWSPFYEQLAADPPYFQRTLRDVLSKAGQPDSVYLAGAKLSLPAELAEYLSGQASAVLRVEDLQAYVSAAESTLSTDPWVLEARTEVNRLRLTGDELVAGTLPPSEAGRQLRRHVDRLDNLIGARREATGTLGVMREKLDAALGELMTVVRNFMPDQEPADSATPADRWVVEAVPHVDAIDAALREWHRYVSLGP
jgi:energy-coupling factor transporter ATP-binding protein EcfA2